jgi:multiple sugar transport system ATP-binding protein
MAEVRLEGLRKVVGGFEILAGITLTVRDGELFTIVGPSGCGKSTLLHLIAGLERPTAGRLLFDGQDVTSWEPRERDVALVFQSYALYPHMTVADNLAFPLRVAPRRSRPDRAAREREVRRVAGLLGLEPLLDRRPGELSGGQRQRVALGRALIRRPRVFLLDEPLSNLDAQLRADMRAELRRLHDREGITMIYVTHDQTEAMTLADRLAVLRDGRLQQVGTPRDLYEAPDNAFVAGFIGYPSMNLLPARLARGRIVAGPLQLPCPADLAAASGLHEGAAVTLGLRPEDLRVSVPVPPAGATTGLVRLVEPMGGQTWVTLELETGCVLVGRGDKECSAKPGARASLWIETMSPHLFDAGTGLRLTGEPAALKRTCGRS